MYSIHHVSRGPLVCNGPWMLFNMHRQSRRGGVGGVRAPLLHKKVILLHIMNVASAQSEGQPSFVYNGQESTVFQMRRMQNRLPSKY